MELLKYFYHPDHLGSTSWITDGNGDAIQYMHYLPFGEEWVDQRNSSWNAPYTFSGKEKDLETGYGYFGARYYDSGLSIWLSVDPMSDKYPSMSPYNYCANNPVILVDPDGRKIVIKETINDDGTRSINITYTAYIRNQSNTAISDDEMNGSIKRIKGAIESVYGGNPDDNTQTTVTTNVDIQILPEEKIDPTRHIITIANLPEETPDLAELNGMEMWLDVRLLANSPTDPKGFCETCASGIRNTLERDVAHEWGHNAGLSDIFTPEGNIMIQDDQKNAGRKFTNDQINFLIPISKWRNSENNNSAYSTNTYAIDRKKY
jgi:RHS repeat-associated protein